MKKQNIIIAFTRNTNKKSAKIFCRNFRHCCVLFPFKSNNKNAVLHCEHKKSQFILIQIGIDGVRIVHIGPREIKTMKQNGWVFVNVGANIICPKYNRGFAATGQIIFAPTILTCVGFAKRCLGIRNPFIWTPDGLYRKIRHRGARGNAPV